MRKCRVLSALLFCSSFCSSSLWSQAMLPDAPQPQTAQAQTPSPAPAATQEKPQRILGLVPLFDVAQAAAPYQPLSAREKFHLFTDSTFDRSTLIIAAADAGINQATNTPEGYGQGGEGYAKRFGSAVGDAVTYDLFSKFLYPVAFHQDPRYFAKSAGTGGQRFGYAISRVFVTRADSGRNQFNASQVLAAFTSAGITNAWLPPEDRDVETTVARAGSRLAVGMVINVFKEFWPEIRHKMGMRK